MTEEIKNNNHIEEDEIDLIALAKTVWDGRKTIILSVIICAILGVAVALLSPKEYTAATTMVPQTSDAGSMKLGGLSSLASMAGFNLDMSKGGGELSPMIYPQILQSVPFQLELMDTPFKFEKVDQPVSLFEYYTEIKKPGALSLVKKYTLGLPFVILGAIKGENEPLNAPATNTIPLLTEDQDDIREMLLETISLEVNDKDGYLSLTTRFPEALLSAQVATKALELLQQYITEFKIEKASAQLKFVEERYVEKKKEFETVQAELAAFRDRNKNVTSALARTEEERLQNEYQLAFEVYSGLAQQLEQARIKVKEDTPVFSIIKPVTVPNEKSKPKRAMILAIWIFLGAIAGIGWIFGKQFLGTLKEKWNEENVQE